MASLWANCCMLVLYTLILLSSATSRRIQWGFVAQKLRVTKRSPLPNSLYLCIYSYLFLVHASIHPTSLACFSCTSFSLLHYSLYELTHLHRWNCLNKGIT